jgi:hypothetical protein
MQISRAHGYIVCATAGNISLYSINGTLLASAQAPAGSVTLVPSSEEEDELLVSGWCCPTILELTTA